MFFTLVRCSIIMSRFLSTYLHPCFLPYVWIYWISVRLLMSQEKCPILQVLFILKFGTFAFFFRIVLYSLQVHNGLLQTSKMSHLFFSLLYCTLFKFIMVYSKRPKCHTCFFPFCLILLVSNVWKSLSCQVSYFFSYRTDSLIIVLFRLWMFVMSYQFFVK